jgi:hypothetical protein
MLLGPDAVDTVLCLAETPVRPLHRVTRRSQQLVIQELQRRVGGWRGLGLCRSS